ncbi:MAG: 2-C-methyl-D-erythritol 2,4-cyclodiphosphate synthase [Synergistaceae bacterium]|jgi:2-C-methyl-D-erythritol 4-phosphate cytidylyltransferase/2-C-methyl-D-erythritol 2,4-cyclodiphosphate synthase|nr:2-C-methyl-D-erythritol 2,4-cyclodiphosphate synthase [Synergistaceae bacterium]
MSGLDSHTWSFVLAAAGSGNRIGGIPKQFRRLGPEPMWKWSALTAEKLFELGLCNEMIAVFPRDCEAVRTKNDAGIPTKYVNGGNTRTESVRNGLLAADGEYVMVHDAARPFLSPEICETLIDAVSDETGAIPVLQSVDSLKMIAEEIKILPRDKIFRTQTPQAFKRTTLLDIMDSISGATDEASLWLDSGRKIICVPGSERNFKVTTEFDWIMAKALVEAGKTVKIGMGYDIHELVPGRKLILGGIELRSELGLLGHSDADIICHAIADALLGASGEGDIGALFPASDERYKDADSMALLKSVLSIIAGKNWSVGNIDVTLVAQVPRIGDKVAVITNSLMKLLKSVFPYAELSVKVKSGEHVGSAGRAECMECFAVAVVERHDMYH